MNTGGRRLLALQLALSLDDSRMMRSPRSPVDSPPTEVAHLVAGWIESTLLSLCATYSAREPMPTSEYYKKQGELLLRMALATSNPERAASLEPTQGCCCRFLVFIRVSDYEPSTNAVPQWPRARTGRAISGPLPSAQQRDRQPHPPAEGRCRDRQGRACRRYRQRIRGQRPGRTACRSRRDLRCPCAAARACNSRVVHRFSGEGRPYRARRNRRSHRSDASFTGGSPAYPPVMTSGGVPSPRPEVRKSSD
jgi:hypothetical protein